MRNMIFLKSIRLYSSVKTLNYLHNYQPINKNVQIQGWIKRLSKQKELMFMDVDDGSGSKPIQVVAHPSEKNAELTCGSTVEISGQLVASTHPKQEIELRADTIKVIGPCDPKTFPFRNKKQYNFDYFRQYLHLRPRAKPFQTLLRVRNEATMCLHSYFQQNGFISIPTPILTSNDCEGGGEVFEVQPADKSKLRIPFDTTDDLDGKDDKKDVIKGEYFDDKVFLTVSGQLHLETVVCGGIPKVYNITPAFRAENNRTRRHLSEFYMLEVEIGFTKKLNDLLELIEDMFKNTTGKVLLTCEEEINFLMQYQGVDGSSDRLKTFLSSPFLKCSYSEAVDILSKHSTEISTKIKWGMSLQREHEEFIVKYFGNKPIFITDFPEICSPFYMKSNGDETKTVASVDLLVPVVGELCGGSLREDNLKLLEDRCRKLKLCDSLNWYLDLRKYGNLPHGGFGMGFERYLQFITGIANIRDTIPFPRSAHHCKM